MGELVGSSLTPETAAAINEARLQLVQELHCAVHGDTWARPLSPEQVWLDLLDHVRQLVAEHEALQDEADAGRSDAPNWIDRWDIVNDAWADGFNAALARLRSVGVPTNPEEPE